MIIIPKNALKEVSLQNFDMRGNRRQAHLHERDMGEKVPKILILPSCLLAAVE